MANAGAIVFDGLVIIAGAAFTLGASIDAWRHPPQVWDRAGLPTGVRTLMLLTVPLIWVCGLGLGLAGYYWLSWRRRLLRAERGETLDRYVPFIPGQRKFEEAMTKVDRTVAENLAAGLAEFSIVVTESELGTLTRLDVFVEGVVKHLQEDPRLRVVDVSLPDWGRVATIRVAPTGR